MSHTMVVKKAPSSLLEAIIRDGANSHLEAFGACEQVRVEPHLESVYFAQPYFFAYLFDCDQAISVYDCWLADCSVEFILPRAVQERLNEITSIDLKKLHQRGVLQRVDNYERVISHLDEIIKFYREAVESGMGIIVMVVP